MALSEAQQKIVDDDSRFRVIVAGRRFGKTYLAIRELCYHARESNKDVWYVSPSYRQSKNIVWKQLKNKLTDLKWAKKINETELSIVLKNDSTISLKGADNHDSLRGVGLDFLVLDEFADIDPEAWYETLRPTLSDKQGKAMFIGTPKGLNWAYELYNNTQEDPQSWSSYQFTTLDGGQVSEEEVQSAKRDLGEREFRQEYMATFETYSGRIYYAFERDKNVEKCEVEDRSVIYVGMDFNIDPMSAVIAVRYGDVLHIVDEIRMFSSNTNEMVDEIKSRYANSKVWVYPDPASRQRKTSAAGQTDLTILQNSGFVVKVPHKHTAVRDRINAVNSKLCNSMNTRTLKISPTCKHTIEGLERQLYKEGTSQPDKDGGYDHMMDALGYMVDYLFPVRKDQPMNSGPLTWGHRTGVTQ